MRVDIGDFWVEVDHKPTDDERREILKTLESLRDLGVDSGEVVTEETFGELLRLGMASVLPSSDYEVWKKMVEEESGDKSQ